MITVTIPKFGIKRMPVTSRQGDPAYCTAAKQIKFALKLKA